MSQVAWVAGLLDRLIQNGVREFVACAGSRNSPFIHLLAQQTQLPVHWGFDERSAAFFALGRARHLRAPVAVITTSGTAAAELLPAVIEAHHSGDSLYVVTANRPRSQWGSGSPQTIYQDQLFAGYARRRELSQLNPRTSPAETLSAIASGVEHWDVQLTEPLLDDRNWTWNPAKRGSAQGVPSNLVAEGARLDCAYRVLTKDRAPVVVVGPLETHLRESVVRNLVAWGLPVAAEAASGLLAVRELEPLLVSGGYDVPRTWLAADQPVIRLGQTPTGRFWRDLEAVNSTVVQFVSAGGWAGLGRPTWTFSIGSLAAAQHWRFSTSTELRSLREQRQTQQDDLQALLSQFPESEAAWIRALSNLVDDNDFVYLGNSLPIREWDRSARMGSWAMGFSRGANGIDGQMSTFLGMTRPCVSNWAVLGDLTTLYDLSAPWWSQKMKDRTLRLVVINNGGGRIFSKMYPESEAAFVNPHSLRFEGLAALWGWTYSSLKASSELLDLQLDTHHLIEIQVNHQSSLAFEQAWGAR